MRLNPAKFSRGLYIQVSNIHALMIRDMMMRYGRDNIGFAWVILEPMILTAGVMIIWSLVFGEYKQGTRLIEVVLTGYMPLTLWRHMTGPPALLFRRSISLLYHRSISLFDILFARQFLEFIGATAAGIVVWGILAMADLVAVPARFDLLIGGWLMMALMGLGAGAIIAAVTERWEVGERFIAPAQYLLIPISGSFFLLDWVPEEGRRLLLLNPLVHCYEMFRAGYWGAMTPTYYYAWYPLMWGAALSLFGLILVNKLKKRVQLT